MSEMFGSRYQKLLEKNFSVFENTAICCVASVHTIEKDFKIGMRSINIWTSFRRIYAKVLIFRWCQVP